LRKASPVVRRPKPLSLRELEIRAEALAGRSVAEVARALDVSLPHEPKRAKGFVGMLVEQALGADPKAGEDPDFPELGVELKTVPIDKNGAPAESTFVCSIAMAHADQEEWTSSRLRQRLQHVLWVPVEAAKVSELPLRRIGRPVLWRPDVEQERLLESDWQDLMGAIGAGRGGTLTAREGVVLQVRPKAARADERTLGPGPDGPQQTLPLGFYLRQSFTAALLHGRVHYPTAHGC
jgi:DNA mismatch repair protein MutH